MTDMTKDVSATSVVAGASIDYGRFLDCVHCGLCTASCPTYLETGNENDSPRGRIYLMRGVVDGRLDLTPAVRGHLDLCLDCRSCETACPSGVQYGRLIEPFRVDMQKSERPGWFQRFVLYGLFPFPGRLRLALAPARLLQLVGLDRLFDWVGLHKLLPGPLGRMYRLLPRLTAGAGREAGSGGAVWRLCRGGDGFGNESSHRPSLASKWLRGGDSPRPGVLWGNSLSQRFE